MKNLSSFRLKTRFDKRTYIMGILNVTPDSFSDGGKFIDKAKALKHALGMIRDGADIIDVGGESTRPGAREVSVSEELSRVIPAISSIRRKSDVAISIDTRHAIVAREAIGAGASIVNDVSGLKHDPDMAGVVARSGAIIIIMHMRGNPLDMQNNIKYKDVVKDTIRELRESIAIAKKAGVSRNKIIIDPGIGFSKTFLNNIEILNRLKEFKGLGYPLCIGTSRKSFIGTALGQKTAGDRLIGTIATNVAAIMNGANIIRVHDVKELTEAARMTDRIMKICKRLT